MDTRTIFFVGKPGSGKGTQAKLLSERTGWPVIGAGAQFREIAEEDTPAGHLTKAAIDAGILMPHWFAMYLYQQALFALPGDASVIFDGFNRKVPEAELIIASLTWLGRSFSIVYLSISDEEVRRRLEGRKQEENRVDDSVIEERIREFHTYTTAALDTFRNASVLIEVNGERSPEEVAADVNQALKLG